jgi:SAM-dependent methyltransferase
MTLVGKAWMLNGRLRTRRRATALPAPHDLIREFAPGKSFADIGCMWNVHGGLAFHAEEVGANPVAGVDLIAPTPQFLAEHEKRRSKVRFVHGDLNDRRTLDELGAHDVIWCSGVLYHLPNPLHSLELIREVVRERLLLGTASIPEVPGLANVCVFYPGLPASQRGIYDQRGNIPGAVRHGLTTDFDPTREYGNWYWGFTPSAVRSMLEVAGFRVERIYDVETGGSFTTYAVARRA